MKLQQEPVLRQNLSVTVTPRLLQSMHVLQLSSAELASYVQDQSSENPLLEVLWSDAVPGRAQRSRIRQAPFNGTPRPMPESAAATETLESALLSQLRLSGLGGRIFAIAKYLAGNINENGFLNVALSEAALRFGAEEREAGEALHALQSLEPAGIAARSLQESLCIQIRRDGQADPWAEALVTRCLKELGAGQWKTAARMLNITPEQVKQSYAYIRTLNPRPGLAYQHQRTLDVKPDALIRKIGNRYVCGLIDGWIPQVSVNRNVQRLCLESGCKETEAYAKQHVQAANWLIHSLEQRQRTFMRVIEAIADEQQSFLERGASGLKPMNLKTIADKLQLHESTVSRAIQNKYVQTPHGMVELKYFFGAGLATADGETASAERIKSRIRQLIEEENKSKPLSDQQLTDLLVKEGLHISRRTVMKYREEVHILSSRLRAST
ncbi:RNA polymerase factor sigma-54 [Paenibacillus hodogayensis]|uniref:RNA polymerase factor sigma-54 n=1 Tax=Paenibacillus hodogayensis TaxID=279208 RepID=A0ABV5W561_9BACL